MRKANFCLSICTSSAIPYDVAMFAKLYFACLYYYVKTKSKNR